MISRTLYILTINVKWIVTRCSSHEPSQLGCLLPIIAITSLPDSSTSYTALRFIIIFTFLMQLWSGNICMQIWAAERVPDKYRIIYECVFMYQLIVQIIFKIYCDMCVHQIMYQCFDYLHVCHCSKVTCSLGVCFVFGQFSEQLWLFNGQVEDSTTGDFFSPT